MLRDLLRGEGVVIGREMVRAMMRRMCIEALYRRPNTSKPAPGHKIYPYLRGMAVERPNQVWGYGCHAYPDGTRLRLPRGRRGLVYPAGFWPGGCRSPWRWISASTRSRRSARKVWPARDIQHRSGQSVHQRRLHRAATGVRKIAISMDGKGSWRDNVFVERLWRWNRSNTRRFICELTTASPDARASLGRYSGFL